MRMLRVRKPYWDKNLVPCMMERAPDWCKPVQVQTVDREDGEDTARRMLESKTISLSPSFRMRNLLASSQFMYFAWQYFLKFKYFVLKHLLKMADLPIHNLQRARLLNPAPQLLSGTLDVALLQHGVFEIGKLDIMYY